MPFKQPRASSSLKNCFEAVHRATDHYIDRSWPLQLTKLDKWWGYTTCYWDCSKNATVNERAELLE